SVALLPPCPFTHRLLPLPTPFPYTTLFRSLRSCAGDGGRRNARRGVAGRDGVLRAAQRTRARGAGCRFRARRRAQRAAHFSRHRDRKSTRLNSSHVAISYAVFCLKKKNLKF